MVFAMLVDGTENDRAVVMPVTAPPTTTRAQRPNNTQKMTRPRLFLRALDDSGTRHSLYRRPLASTLLERCSTIRMWHAYVIRSQSWHRLPIAGGQRVSGVIFLIDFPQTESRSQSRTACAGPTGSASASL